MIKEEVLFKTGNMNIRRWEADGTVVIEVHYSCYKDFISISPEGEIEAGELNKVSGNIEGRVYIKDSELARKIKDLLSRPVADIDGFTEMFNEAVELVEKRQEEIEGMVAEKINELAAALADLMRCEIQLNFMNSSSPQKVVEELLREYFDYLEY